MGFGVCFSYTSTMMEREYWSYVFQQFGIEELYEVGRPENIASNYKPHAIANYSDLPKNRTLVIVAHRDAKYLQGKTPLNEFIHPKDCIYVFGSDRSNFYPQQFIHHKFKTVYIPPSHIEMYSFQAGAIIMWDRWQRLLNNG